MAVYSGLGTGTELDPYQITTISQFKEMDSADWAGVYFKLMNDLDFSAETVFEIANLYCHFDGDNYSINNIPLKGAGLVIQSGCSIKKIKIKVRDAVFTSAFYFLGSESRTVSNVILENIRFISNIFTLYVNQNIDFSSQITFDSTCYMAHLHVEGLFSNFFGKIKCVLEYCSFNISVQFTTFRIDSGGVFRYNYVNINKAKYPNIYPIFYGSSGTITQNIFCILYESGAGNINVLTTGQNTISDNLIIANKLSATGALYLLSASIGYGKGKRNFFTGDILSVNGTKNIFSSSINDVNYCYYQKTKVVSSVPTDAEYHSVGLTDAQCLIPSSFGTFDFTNVWQIGSSYPVLRNVQTPEFELPIFDTTTAIERISGGTTIKITTTSLDQTLNYGFDLYVNDVYITNYENSAEVLYSGLVEDCTVKIKPYAYKGASKIYVDTISYTHYFSDGYLTLSNVVADKLISLKNGTNSASWIHGTCMYNGYIYGSSRNVYSQASVNNPNKGCIVKVDINNIESYTLFPIYLNEAETINAMQMDSLVRIGRYLYTVASSTGNQYDSYLVKFDTDNDTYQVYKLTAASTNTDVNANKGAPSTSDEQYLYVYLNNRKLHKIDVSVFNSVNRYNVSSNWVTNSIVLDCSTHNPSGYITHPHTMVNDANYLYVGFGTSSTASEHEVQKVRKSDMVMIDYVLTPQMTDDMTQTPTHIFIGIELRGYSVNAYGYGVGAAAIRKEDFHLTTIKDLSQYTKDIASYASLLFGNYIIDLRSNRAIAALDISNADSWSQSDSKGKYTLKNYYIYKPGDTLLIDRPVNEVFLTESGKFIGFCWGNISDIIQFELTGLNYFAAPTIVTENSAIIDNTVSLSGYIQSTGGKTGSECGFIIGRESNLSDGVAYPCATVETNFSLLVSNLSIGTFYWRAYAINSEGTGYGSIDSFNLSKTMKLYFGGKQITKIYKGAIELSGRYFNN